MLIWHPFYDVIEALSCMGPPIAVVPPQPPAMVVSLHWITHLLIIHLDY